MTIAIFGKYDFILQSLESYLSNKSDDIEVFIYSDNRISSVRGRFDFVILNSLGYIGDITGLMEQASMLVYSIQNLILIQTDQIHCRFCGYREFSAYGSLENLLEALGIDSEMEARTEGVFFNISRLYKRFSHSHELTMNLQTLTKQEKKIICYLLSDKEYPEICTKFNISDSTLKKHNNHIYKKMNVKSRNELLMLLETNYCTKVRELVH